MSAPTRGPDPAAVDDISVLWTEYKASGDPAARDRLIVHYSPLVKFVAGRVGVGLPRNVDQGDLVSNGIFGLIDAIEKFEPERGFKFETYAINRIKGAILDELRAMDWVPRSVRSRAREIERSVVELEHRLQRTPSDEELASHMNVRIDDLQDNLAEISTLGLIALDEVLGPDTGSSLGDMVADSSGLSPEQAFQKEETRRLLADAINRLPDRERLVLTLYYFEGLTLAEVGDVLGVTESRVCQIHAKSVMSLRNRMTEPSLPLRTSSTSAVLDRPTRASLAFDQARCVHPPGPGTPGRDGPQRGSPPTSRSGARSGRKPGKEVTSWL
jgi:RNA polymerase sigma factor FliA